MPKRTTKPMVSKSIRMSEKEMEFLGRNGQHHSTQLHIDLGFLKSLLELNRTAGDRITLSEAVDFVLKVTSSPADAIALMGKMLKDRNPSD